jgi:PhnB protein
MLAPQIQPLLQQEPTMSTTLTPYLSFDGNTREAFAFYEKALGAKIETMMSYADMPAPATPSEGCGVAGKQHRAAGMPYDGVKGVMLALQYDTVDQAHGAFNALSQGGQVTMPMAPAFWAQTFGMLTDRFGVSWAVNGAPIAFK